MDAPHILAALHPDRIGGLIVVDVAHRTYASHHGDLFDALGEVSLQGALSRQLVEELLRFRIPDERMGSFS